MDRYTIYRMVGTGAAEEVQGRRWPSLGDMEVRKPETAVDAAVSCNGRGGGVRPQGGGGVDHPTKVQQRKAQTESHIFPSLGFILPSILCISLYLSSTPGVLGTLFSNID